MSPEQSAHIVEERLLEVVIENAPTTQVEDGHLAGCRRCRSAIEDLKADLQSLRRASKSFTPERTRRVTLPESTAPSRRWGLGGWRIAAGAVATLCLATVFWWQTSPRSPDPVAATPDPVMLETRMLAENAMPADYQAMMESLDGGFDQGFIDFIIPPLDEESLS